MSEAQGRTSPVVVIAAAAVILFSAVGIGVMTGIIPNSFSKTGESQVLNKEEAKKTEAPSSLPAPEKKATAPAAHKKAPVSEATRRSTVDEPTRVASAPRSCANCGRVEAINAIQQAGEGSGLGAVAGGVIGGILGNQVGAGSGRTAATVVGAGAGAYAGHEIEKQVKKTLRYDVVVRLDDGTSRTFSYQTEPAFRAGDRIKIIDGAIVAN
ncbi:MAG: glycine zipper 2TM domain-containing protein [Burkholderiales bacterium]|nr:glycine zipper 2TM domain-containing protein [Burkholderiales bacterium]